MRVPFLPMLLLASVLSACDSGNPVANDTANASSLGISYQMREFKRQGGAKCPSATIRIKPEDVLCALVRFSYPEISSDTKPELASKMNELIKHQLLDTIDGAPSQTTVSQTIEAFADNFIQDYQNDVNNFSSWEIERKIKVVYNTNTLLTLLFEEFGFTGGAHPFNGSRFIVLNLATGNPVTLDDLMNPGYEAALNVEGERAFREARQLAEHSSLEEDGFTFVNNAFVLNDNYGVNRDGLSFIFNSYEVAPYVMGPTEFTIPYEDISSLIRTDGLLGSKVK